MTCLALDVTTPMELAFASLFDRGLVRVVPSPAAHEVAAVGRSRRPVADAPLGAPGSGQLVGHAVVGRLVDVHQVLGRGQVVAGVADLQLAAVVDLDLGGAVVLVLQVVADLAEGRQLLPAGHQRARAGHAMALAGDADFADDGLETGGGLISKSVYRKYNMLLHIQHTWKHRTKQLGENSNVSSVRLCKASS